MIVRPGRILLIVVAILTLLGSLAFLWGAVLWMLGGLMILVAFSAWRDSLAARALLKQIQVSRTLPRIAGRDLFFDSIVTIRNSGPQEVSGTLRDVVPVECTPAWTNFPFHIRAGEVLTFTTRCRIPQRGEQHFGPVWVRVVGPWQLTETQQEFSCHGDIKILPETFASREELQKEMGAQLLMLDKIVRERQQGAGTEFVSLDAYRTGDDPRRIDWRSTARQGIPIVRRYQVERHRDVLILIDSGRLMGTMTERGSKLDCAVDAALNLAQVALHSGDRCGIGIFDSELRGYLAPTAGRKALGGIVDSLYNLQTRWQETDFTRLFAEVQRRQSKRSFLIVLSDLGDAETSRMHCAALARLSRRHLLLFAALRTPLLNQVIHQEATSIEAGARQAVAMGLVRDRSESLHALKHGGVQILDVEPRQLTLPLINRFIELRQRNLL
ncbi:DUF58 domain-containing protein [Planctomicrobium sp. SH661]|uniref:DUF58 domain-containing protein n=1 Tax=Planctomicrobium sp. SH661 TaxID=3448124 RepID=UPI003F5BAC31